MTQSGAIDPRAHRVLAGASRVRVLECLRACGEAMTAVELAEQVGLHANTVRMHLDQLAGAGLVECRPEQRHGRGRPRLLYVAVVRDGDGDPTRDPGRAPVRDPVRDPLPAAPDGDDGYRTLAAVLAGHLERRGTAAGREAAAAGRAWAHSLPPAPPSPRPASAAEATDRLVGLMDRLGFAPSTPAPAGPIELHRCPFHQVAEDHSEVVCGVHLGLIQGVLEDLDAPLRVTGLEPFVTSDRCLAHLEALPEAVPEALPEGHPEAQPAAHSTERPVP